MRLIECDASELPENEDSSSSWLFYDYSAVRAARNDVIPIREICRQHEVQWLNDLAVSHAQWINRLHLIDRSVWFHPLSRLDARPWAQAQVIKPLMIALGFRRWIQQNPDCHQVYCVGCPPEFFTYIREISSAEGLECSFRKRDDQKFRKWPLIVSCVKSVPEIARQLFHAVKDSQPRKRISHNSTVLSSERRTRPVHVICYDLLHGDRLTDGYRYYFTTLFDGLEDANLLFLANGRVPGGARNLGDRLPGGSVSGVAAIDFCGSGWKVWFALRSLWLDWMCRLIPVPALQVDHVACPSFWRNFRQSGIGRNFVLYAYICRKAIKSLAKNCDVWSVLVPYEEKGIERAISMEAANHELNLIGYTPHPQHSLAICLTDLASSTCPKPNEYAVCGPAYIPFFRNECGKGSVNISVWGTAKGGFASVDRRDKYLNNAGQQLSLLLLLSHPEELKIFRSWLQLDPSCLDGWTLLVRPYRAVEEEFFDLEMRLLRSLKRDLIVSNSSLADDVERSDLALFCGTSAGIEAIQMGCPAAYADLNDLFLMNPCFDLFGPIPICEGPEDLRSLLDKFSKDPVQQITQILPKLREYAKTLFAPADPDEIKKSF